MITTSIFPLMKPRLFLILGLALGLTAFGSAFAQMTTDTTDKLDAAVALLNAGKPKEARAVLATVGENDPKRAIAKGYDALCLYQLDKLKFIKSISTAEMQAAQLPEGLREELDYRQIDTLLFYRKFEELLPKTVEFAQRHADSPRAETMAEYQMAALYERGMKNLGDAAFTRARKGDKDVADTAKRMQAGQDNLQQFLKLATDSERNGYQSLTNRDLATEVVKALAALGGEDEALKLVPLADRENMALALIHLHNKNDTDADANLRRMSDFLNDFPNAKSRPRVLFEMADVAMKEAWRLKTERQPDKAAPYLEQAHRLFNGVIEDSEGGVMASDVLEARESMLMIYCQEQDYTNLSHSAAQLVANTPAGSPTWLVAKLYDAYGLVYQKKLDEAATELDEILATGFKGNPSYDGLLVSAAEWRINVAKKTKDEATVQRIAQQVQDSKCYASLKRTFAKRFVTLLSPPAPTSN
jgi:hypothetical protein